MKRNKYLILIVVLVILVSLVACKKDEEVDDLEDLNISIGVEDLDIEEEDDSRTSEDIINEFGEVVTNNDDIEDIIDFIDENIKKVTSVEGDQMVIELISRLEKSKEDLGARLKELNDGELFNLTAGSIEKFFPENKVKDIKDKELKELVKEMMGNKYKLEASEGMYYPIVDYEKIKEYDDYISDEIKDYIYLKAIDSNKKITEDAALLIGYDELANIIIETEKYIEKYAGGVYHEEVEEMYKSKLYIYLSGLPNTLIYDYNTMNINQDVLESYIKTGTTGDTVTSFIVGKYVNKIRNNENIIDKEILKEADLLVAEALTLLVHAK